MSGTGFVACTQPLGMAVNEVQDCTLVDLQPDQLLQVYPVQGEEPLLTVIVGEVVVFELPALS